MFAVWYPLEALEYYTPLDSNGNHSGPCQYVPPLSRKQEVIDFTNKFDDPRSMSITLNTKLNGGKTFYGGPSINTAVDPPTIPHAFITKTVLDQEYVAINNQDLTFNNVNIDPLSIVSYDDEMDYVDKISNELHEKTTNEKIFSKETEKYCWTNEYVLENEKLKHTPFNDFICTYCPFGKYINSDVRRENYDKAKFMNKIKSMVKTLNETNVSHPTKYVEILDKNFKLKDIYIPDGIVLNVAATEAAANAAEAAAAAARAVAELSGTTEPEAAPESVSTPLEYLTVERDGNKYLDKNIIQQINDYYIEQLESYDDDGSNNIISRYITDLGTPNFDISDYSKADFVYLKEKIDSALTDCSDYLETNYILCKDDETCSSPSTRPGLYDYHGFTVNEENGNILKLKVMWNMPPICSGTDPVAITQCIIDYYTTKNTEMIDKLNSLNIPDILDDHYGVHNCRICQNGFDSRGICI